MVRTKLCLPLSAWLDSSLFETGAWGMATAELFDYGEQSRALASVAALVMLQACATAELFG